MGHQHGTVSSRCDRLNLSKSRERERERERDKKMLAPFQLEMILWHRIVLFTVHEKGEKKQFFSIHRPAFKIDGLCPEGREVTIIVIQKSKFTGGEK